MSPANGAAPMLIGDEPASPPPPQRPARPVVTASPARVALLRATRERLWVTAARLYKEQLSIDKEFNLKARRGSGAGADAWVVASDAVAKAAALVPATQRRAAKRKLDVVKNADDN